MFQKDMKISLLLDFYGDILSEKRRSIVGMYYDEDLSLAEIAEETGISRQGVRDSIQKSVRELKELEDKLGLAERFKRLRHDTEQIAKSLEEAALKDADECKAITLSAAEKLKQLDF